LFFVLCSLCLVPCFACTPNRPAPRAKPSAKLAPALPYTSDDVIFAARYPNPIVNTRRPAGLAGLMVHEVFDKSQQAEDPIQTSFWLVNPSGERFRLDRGGVERALRSVRFAASTSAEALRVATLRFSHDGDYQVMEGPLLPRVKAPREKLALVDPPAVKKLGPGRYKVTFHVFYSSSTARFFGRDNRALTACDAEVSPGGLSLRQRSVWSAFGSPR